MVAAGYVMKQASQGQGGLGGALGGMFGKDDGRETGSTSRSSADSGGILDELIGAAGKILGR